MSDYVQKYPPSPSREVRDIDGYRASFYPGFVRRLTVRRAENETVIYEQTQPFILPAGETRAWPSSVLHFSGGPGDRDIRLQLDDPRGQVARVEVFFKSTGAERSTEDDEALVIEETPILCPPMCPEQ